ncbi:MAG: hypothetical protein JWP97_3469 [Labilithrix sp.]|nr:hypothetical protein [Labilithrix sp.]
MHLRRTLPVLLAASAASFLTTLTGDASAATRQVGPGKTYASPCAAIAAAQPGDVIEVAAGSYDGDTCAWSTDNLTVRGVGGRAKIDAGKDPAKITQGKGIFVITAANATLESLELAGATAGSKNGAGVRHQGKNLTVRDCYFHDNEDGILGAPAVPGTGEVLVETTELANNGQGDGQSHNLYFGDYAKLTLRASYSHGARVGHLLKSRALENDILYNRLTDESGTTASYEINLPDGGLSFVIGNLIEQSATTENPAIIDYASEGRNPDLHLFVINNTIVNTKGSGTFVQTSISDPPAVLTNNIFAGGGAASNQASAVLTTNLLTDPGLVGVAAFDYHLAAGSAAIDQGTDPGSYAGHLLVPGEHYEHPRSTKPRPTVGRIDIGAYEFGEAPAGADGGPTGGDAGGTNGSDAGGGADAGDDLGETAAAVDTGCGCRVMSTRGAGTAGGALALGLAAAASLVRRRRRR